MHFYSVHNTHFSSSSPTNAAAHPDHWIFLYLTLVVCFFFFNSVFPANLAVFDDGPISRSFMNFIKSTRPRTHPWGTPLTMASYFSAHYYSTHFFFLLWANHDCRSEVFPPFLESQCYIVESCQKPFVYYFSRDIVTPVLHTVQMKKSLMLI